VSEALAIIGELYRHEEAIRKRKPQGQAKQDSRARHYLTLVVAIFAWLHTQRNRLVSLGATLCKGPELCR
jgi:hypothetical protein